jgi:hypothetical protein
MIRASLIAAVVLSLASFVTRAVPDVSGHWKVAMAGEKQKTIEGSLTITQKGSALTAAWQSIDAWTLTGTIDEKGGFVLQSELRPIPFNDGGKQGSAQARWVFRGTLTSGSLTGTAALEIAGRAPMQRKWSATKSSK